MMDWKELHNQPDGVVFCENDYGSSALFIKLESLENDILIQPIYDTLDDGPLRIGWRDMEECIRNSKEYHVLSEQERNSAVLRLIGPYVLSS